MPELTLQYAHRFEHDVRALTRRYRHIRSDLDPVFARLLAGERPGDRIRGTEGEVYKVRVRNSDVGRGKRGGYRLIYLAADPETVVLISIYFKSDLEDISAEEIRRAVEEYESAARSGAGSGEDSPTAGGEGEEPNTERSG